MKSFFRTDAQPSMAATWMLSIVFFLLLITAYLVASYYRHLDNPQDKVMPTFAEMLDGLKRSAFEPDRNGDLRLWIDTFASARRFGIAIGGGDLVRNDRECRKQFPCLGRQPVRVDLQPRALAKGRADARRPLRRA